MNCLDNLCLELRLLHGFVSWVKRALLFLLLTQQCPTPRKALLLIASSRKIWRIGCDACESCHINLILGLFTRSWGIPDRWDKLFKVGPKWQTVFTCNLNYNPANPVCTFSKLLKRRWREKYMCCSFIALPFCCDF